MQHVSECSVAALHTVADFIANEGGSQCYSSRLDVFQVSMSSWAAAGLCAYPVWISAGISAAISAVIRGLTLEWLSKQDPMLLDPPRLLGHICVNQMLLELLKLVNCG